MITEDRLRALLEDAAAAIEPPADGPDRVIAAAQPDEVAPRRRRLPRPSLPRLVAVAAGAVLIVAAGLAWNDRGTSTVSTAAAQKTESRDAPAPDQFSAAASGAASSSQLGASTPSVAAVAAAPPPTVDVTKIVKTGGLEVEVSKGHFGDAVSSITRIAVAAGGYVSDSKTSEAASHPTGTITVRVPAAQFESVSTQLRALGKVRNASSTGTDVTGEYTDVQARLRTLNATRASLLEVLSKARAIGDILAVQDRLNAVQTDIETLQGRQNVLDNQVGLATIAVSVHEPGAAIATTGAHHSALRKAADGFTGTWSSLLAHSGTALAVVIAGAAFLAALIALGQWARRASARRAA